MPTSESKSVNADTRENVHRTHRHQFLTATKPQHVTEELSYIAQRGQSLDRQISLIRRKVLGKDVPIEASVYSESTRGLSQSYSSSRRARSRTHDGHDRVRRGHSRERSSLVTKHGNRSSSDCEGLRSFIACVSDEIRDLFDDPYNEKSYSKRRGRSRSRSRSRTRSESHNDHRGTKSSKRKEDEEFNKERAKLAVGLRDAKGRFSQTVGGEHGASHDPNRFPGDRHRFPRVERPRHHGTTHAAPLHMIATDMTHDTGNDTGDVGSGALLRASRSEREEKRPLPPLLPHRQKSGREMETRGWKSGSEQGRKLSPPRRASDREAVDGKARTAHNVVRSVSSGGHNEKTEGKNISREEIRTNGQRVLRGSLFLGQSGMEGSRRTKSATQLETEGKFDSWISSTNRDEKKDENGDAEERIFGGTNKRNIFTKEEHGSESSKRDPVQSGTTGSESSKRDPRHQLDTTETNGVSGAYVRTNDPVRIPTDVVGSVPIPYAINDHIKHDSASGTLDKETYPVESAVRTGNGAVPIGNAPNHSSVVEEIHDDKLVPQREETSEAPPHELKDELSICTSRLDSDLSSLTAGTAAGGAAAVGAAAVGGAATSNATGWMHQWLTESVAASTDAIPTTAQPTKPYRSVSRGRQREKEIKLEESDRREKESGTNKDDPSSGWKGRAWDSTRNDDTNTNEMTAWQESSKQNHRASSKIDSVNAKNDSIFTHSVEQAAQATKQSHAVAAAVEDEGEERGDSDHLRSNNGSSESTNNANNSNNSNNFSNSKQKSIASKKSKMTKWDNFSFLTSPHMPSPANHVKLSPAYAKPPNHVKQQLESDEDTEARSKEIGLKSQSPPATDSSASMQRSSRTRQQSHKAVSVSSYTYSGLGHEAIEPLDQVLSRLLNPSLQPFHSLNPIPESPLTPTAKGSATVVRTSTSSATTAGTVGIASGTRSGDTGTIRSVGGALNRRTGQRPHFSTTVPFSETNLHLSYGIHHPAVRTNSPALSPTSVLATNAPDEEFNDSSPTPSSLSFHSEYRRDFAPNLKTDRKTTGKSYALGNTGGPSAGATAPADAPPASTTSIRSSSAAAATAASSIRASPPSSVPNHGDFLPLALRLSTKEIKEVPDVEIKNASVSSRYIFPSTCRNSTMSELLSRHAILEYSDSTSGSSQAESPADVTGGSSHTQSPADVTGGSSHTQSPADGTDGSSDTQSPADTSSSLAHTPTNATVGASHREGGWHMDSLRLAVQPNYAEPIKSDMGLEEHTPRIAFVHSHESVTAVVAGVTFVPAAVPTVLLSRSYWRRGERQLLGTTILPENRPLQYDGTSCGVLTSCPTSSSNNYNITSNGNVSTELLGMADDCEAVCESIGSSARSIDVSNVALTCDSVGASNVESVGGSNIEAMDGSNGYSMGGSTFDSSGRSNVESKGGTNVKSMGRSILDSTSESNLDSNHTFAEATAPPSPVPLIITSFSTSPQSSASLALPSHIPSICASAPTSPVSPAVTSFASFPVPPAVTSFPSSSVIPELVPPFSPLVAVPPIDAKNPHINSSHRLVFPLKSRNSTMSELLSRHAIFEITDSTSGSSQAESPALISPIQAHTPDDSLAEAGDSETVEKSARRITFVHNQENSEVVAMSTVPTVPTVPTMTNVPTVLLSRSRWRRVERKIADSADGSSEFTRLSPSGFSSSIRASRTRALPTPPAAGIDSSPSLQPVGSDQLPDVTLPSSTSAAAPAASDLSSTLPSRRGVRVADTDTPLHQFAFPSKSQNPSMAELLGNRAISEDSDSSGGSSRAESPTLISSNQAHTPVHRTAATGQEDRQSVPAVIHSANLAVGGLDNVTSASVAATPAAAAPAATVVVDMRKPAVESHRESCVRTDPLEVTQARSSWWAWGQWRK